MKMVQWKPFLFFLFTFISSVLPEAQPDPLSGSSSATQNPCTAKRTCHECIQIPNCAWCSQPFSNLSDSSSLSRCYQPNRYIDERIQLRCDAEYIYNPSSKRSTISDKTLAKASSYSATSTSTATYREAVQIKPQHIQLSMRVSESYDLRFDYAQAEDYPVDLYYLMDLSKSMEDDKEKLSSLGNLLAQTMQNITSNFRLGFGSFVDKVVMPYVSTVPKKLLEPCDGCKAPYGFRNHLTLSVNTSRFAGEVQNAAVSGNLDAPEGGFDAIMQSVVCRKQIGWREKARRLLVFSTDASFHYAGDGKLGGIIKPNDGHCHLSRGEYTHSTLQDYPSVAQVNQKVKDNAINLIFAVTEEQINIYDRLKDSVEGASAGKLSGDSSNVVELVREQYDKISSSVEMKDNASSVVKVTYYSSCLGGGTPKQTNKCDGLKVGTVVQFTAKIQVTSCPPNRKDWHQRFQIYPVGINESLMVDLDMLCDCDCERANHYMYQHRSPLCSRSGTYQCGICDCDSSHFGRRCECDSDNLGLQQDTESGCRPPNATDVLCSNRGSCICGVCDCHERTNSEEIVSGPYCECDNFSCDRVHGHLCSGPEHGTCTCGECLCKEGWSGSACDCKKGEDACIPPGGGEICSGHGVCDCGVCKCFEKDGARRSGAYCHVCPTCPGKCSELRPCVQCQQFKSGEFDEEQCRNCSFVPKEVDVAEEKEEDDRLCTFIDAVDNCRFTFVYGYDDDGEVIVAVQKTKECPPEIDVLGIVLGVIGAIVFIGLAFLLLWKLLTTIHDRREFAKFEKERMMAKWDTGENPIFKQATSTFKNPTYGGK